jgi:hypothetical protein
LNLDQAYIDFGHAVEACNEQVAGNVEKVLIRQVGPQHYSCQIVFDDGSEQTGGYLVLREGFESEGQGHVRSPKTKGGK